MNFDVVSPNEAVDEMDQAADGSPNHEEACTGVPRLKTPRERDEDKYKTKE